MSDSITKYEEDIVFGTPKYFKILFDRVKETENTPKHYDNSKGSIYKFAEDHKLNPWEFDIVKRVVRCRKKGQFKEDLKKTIDAINLYLKEYEQ